MGRQGAWSGRTHTMRTARRGMIGAWDGRDPQVLRGPPRAAQAIPSSARAWAGVASGRPALAARAAAASTS